MDVRRANGTVILDVVKLPESNNGQARSPPPSHYFKLPRNAGRASWAVASGPAQIHVLGVQVRGLLHARRRRDGAAREPRSGVVCGA